MRFTYFKIMLIFVTSGIANCWTWTLVHCFFFMYESSGATCSRKGFCIFETGSLSQKTHLFHSKQGIVHYVSGGIWLAMFPTTFLNQTQNSALDCKVCHLFYRPVKSKAVKSWKARELHFGPCWIIFSILFNLLS